MKLMWHRDWNFPFFLTSCFTTAIVSVIWLGVTSAKQDKRDNAACTARHGTLVRDYEGRNVCVKGERLDVSKP